MSKSKLKLIVSDLHLSSGHFSPDGSRNILEEFYYDHPFVEWLEYYDNGPFAKSEIELVLNGDILNHLAVFPEEPGADLLTEKNSIERTEAILAGHPKFFEALKTFAKKPNRSVVYLMGNHDLGVAWPKVQQILKNQIHPNLKFFLKGYEVDHLYIEHGNNFLPDNRIDTDNLFLTRGEPEPVLKMPWGSFFVIHFMNPLKKERPYIGKVYPFQMYLKWALIHDTFFAFKTIAHLIAYFLKLNFVRDPKRNFSLKDSWNILRDFSFPFHLNKAAKKILFGKPHIRFVSFGHTHHPVYLQFASGKEYINTGSWNELIGLDVGNLGQQLRFTFAEVFYDEAGEFRASLKEWKGSYREVVEIP